MSHVASSKPSLPSGAARGIAAARNEVTNTKPSPPSAARSQSDEELIARDRQAQRQWLLWLWVARIAVILGIIGLWAFASGRLLDPFWISSPGAVFNRLVRWISDGTLLRNLIATVRVMLLGLLIGSFFGVLMGFLLGRIKFLADLLMPVIQAFYSIPKIALAPLIIMWFGIDEASHVTITVIIVFFLVFENTFSGVRAVDNDLLEVSMVMGASRPQLWRKVIFPSAAEWVFTGLRLAVPYSLVGAVIGQILAGGDGIGYLIRNSSGSFDTAGTFAAIIVLGIIGFCVNILVEWMSRYAGRWRQPTR